MSTAVSKQKMKCNKMRNKRTAVRRKSLHASHINRSKKVSLIRKRRKCHPPSRRRLDGLCQKGKGLKREWGMMQCAKGHRRIQVFCGYGRAIGNLSKPGLPRQTDAWDAQDTKVASGFEGSAVPAGEPGRPSDAGSSGMPRSQSERGKQGHPGAAGRSGVPGHQGERGAPGHPGEAGPMGIPGTQGERGMEGPQGSPGTPGPEGRPGSSGDVQGITILPRVYRYFYFPPGNLTGTVQVVAAEFTDDEGAKAAGFEGMGINGYSNIFINGVLQEGRLYSLTTTDLTLILEGDTVLAGSPITVENVEFLALIQ